MYKKTTTTVVEEHRMKPEGLINPYGPDAVGLKLNVRDKLSLYTADMRNYVISKCDNTEDVPHIVEQMRMDVQMLSSTIQPFFNQDQLVEFTHSMTELTLGCLTIIDDVATSKDPITSSTATRVQLGHMATILDTLGVLLANRTRTVWDLYITTVQQQATARVQKKWREEQDLYDKAYNILVPGQQVSFPNTSSSFADLLTEGVLNRNLV
jgi:hypothetical protein